MFDLERPSEVGQIKDGDIYNLPENLRIPDSYHAKTLKIRTPLVRFASYFHDRAVFQKFERSLFDQVAIDAKSASTLENCPLVAELKFKMSQMGVLLCNALFSLGHAESRYGHIFFINM